MISSFLCFLFAASLQFSEALSTLDDSTLQKKAAIKYILELDVEVRRDLLKLIIGKVNQTVTEQKRLAAECDAKLQSAIASCKACQNDICKPTVIDEINHVVSSVGNSIKHIFGKRCSTSCPICDTVDVNKHSRDQVLISVCGAASIQAQKNASETVKRLQHVYETLRRQPLLTKVEYDYMSMRTEGGVYFTTNFITYSIDGHATRFQSNDPLIVTDTAKTAKYYAAQLLIKL